MTTKQDSTNENTKCKTKIGRWYEELSPKGRWWTLGIAALLGLLIGLPFIQTPDQPSAATVVPSTVSAMPTAPGPTAPPLVEPEPEPVADTADEPVAEDEDDGTYIYRGGDDEDRDRHIYRSSSDSNNKSKKSNWRCIKRDGLFSKLRCVAR